VTSSKAEKEEVALRDTTSFVLTTVVGRTGYARGRCVRKVRVGKCTQATHGEVRTQRTRVGAFTRDCTHNL
jgi:hypothetical protein